MDGQDGPGEVTRGLPPRVTEAIRTLRRRIDRIRWAPSRWRRATPGVQRSMTIRSSICNSGPRTPLDTMEYPCPGCLRITVSWPSQPEQGASTFYKPLASTDTCAQSATSRNDRNRPFWTLVPAGPHLAFRSSRNQAAMHRGGGLHERGQPLVAAHGAPMPHHSKRGDTADSWTRHIIRGHLRVLGLLASFGMGSAHLTDLPVRCASCAWILGVHDAGIPVH